MSILRRLAASLTGRHVGTDRTGNQYFESRRPNPHYRRHRRWVLYAGVPEATAVPPEWHGWLHHTTDAPLPETRRHAWQRDHRPNRTGTAESYRPIGHDYAGGRRRDTTGDYEAWTPGGGGA